MISQDTKMAHSDSHSDSKRFPLLRRLSVVSLVAMFATATILILLHRQDQFSEHEKIAANENETTINFLAHTLGGRIHTLIARSPGQDIQTLQQSKEFDALVTSELRWTSKDDILKLKIYNMAGIAIYSSAANEIGGSSQRPDWLEQALHGETVNSVEYRDAFNGKAGEIHGIDIALTYKPLIYADNQIGVIEIYRDATQIFERVHRNAIKIGLVVFSAFAALYAALFFTVFRTDRELGSWQNSIAESEKSLKEAMDSLAESRNLLNSIIDTAPIRIFWKDKESRYLGCNSIFAKDAGETQQNILGKDDRQLGWKKQAELYRSVDQQVMTSGIPKLNYDEPQTTPEGKTIWLRTSKVPLRNAENQIVGLLGIYQDISEQKLTLMALQKNELHLKLAQSMAHLGSWEYELGNGRIKWSNELSRIFGMPPDVNNHDIDTFNKFVHPDDRASMQAWIVSHMTGKQPGAIEWRCVRPEGTTRYLNGQGELRFNADGNPSHLLGTAQDITDLKQVEEKLLIYQFVSDNAPDSIFWIDAQARIIYVNDATCNTYGYTKEELYAKTILDIDLDSDLDGWPEHWDMLQQKGCITFETNHKRKDGSIFPIEVSANFIKFDGQELNITFVRDISKRKQNEKELRIAAATFETHEAILITDVNAKIVRVNRAFSEITGYSAEDVIGKNPSLMHSGRHERGFYNEMWQRLLHDGAWAGEIWDRRKNGEIYPKWMTITAVKRDQLEITHYVAIFSDITARKRIEQEIHNLAFYDVLTKLPNRRLFLDRFRTALSASTRRNDYGAVLFIDLDRFKTLNDTLGHEYGDLLLTEVGKRIKSCVREMDTVARFGGDEFVVLAESFGLDQDEATPKVALLAEKIREALSLPYYLRDHEHHSSPSIGISLYHGNEDSIESLIEHADIAMYQAKSCGRNTVRFFDPIMQENAAIHDVLNNDLHYAIELQQLHLHYQIQVDNDNRPLGAEAFLRWEHPERGIIMPSEFIPIAEESALIIDISRWALQMACLQLAMWEKDDKTYDLTLTVNISAQHFALPSFVEEVSDVLMSYKANPTRLKMELSEKLVLAEQCNTMDKIHALRNMGVRLSMDNFNTVYSSLSFIRELSSDQLKIHQEFVQGITKDGNDAQLVQTIIDLAKSMDMNVFAEGVETEEQRAFLKQHDCNTYQGYLFGKPVPIEEFDEVIKRL